MKWPLLLLLSSLFASCGLYSDLKETAGNLKNSTASADAVLAKAKDATEALATKIQQSQEVVSASDANSDGKIAGFSEWGLLLTGLTSLLLSNRKTAQVASELAEVDEKRSKNTKELHEQISALKVQLSALSGR